MRLRNLIAIIGPGILVAATGVGAGDLATAGLAGSHLGLSALWLVLAGAILKLALTENLARWQIATGETVLEGGLRLVGAPGRILFVIYLILWSYAVSGALMSACGVTLNALLPIFDNATTGQQVLGIACSLVGLILVRLGGFKIFEWAMSVCIGLMVVTVCVTAILMKPDVGDVLQGMFVPTITSDPAGRNLSLALMGGVGGTVTILCYGYWMRESDRESRDELPTCRIDIAIGYTMTAVFGLAMIIIANGLALDGKGAKLIVLLADRLDETLAGPARTIFLVGAFGAVFSSLLGVWQAIPYIFADWLRIHRHRERPVETTDPAYRWFMVALAVVPMLGLGRSFKELQLTYAISGALFIPVLALTLLIMNNRAARLTDLRNGWLANTMLVVTILLFAADFARRFLL